MDEHQFEERSKNSPQDSAEHAQITLANGSVYDRGEGKIVKGAPMSSQKASELAKKRWADYYAAIEEGAQRGAGVGTTTEAVARITEAVTRTALDSGNRQHIAAAREVMERIMDTPEARAARDDTEDGLHIRGRIPAELLPDLIEAMSRARAMRGD